GEGVGAHTSGPVGVVAVDDGEGDGAAQGLAAANAADHAGLVGLDLHPPAASVAALAAGQVVVDVLGQEGQPRGDAFHDREELGPVRFTCRRPSEPHRSHGSAGCGRAGARDVAVFRPLMTSTLSKAYDPRDVEPRWYAYWLEHGVFAASDDP